MGLFRNKKKGVAPHTWYPEILHWKKGDRVNCWNIAQAVSVSGSKYDWATFNKYRTATTYAGQHVFKFISVDQFGKIFLEDNDGDLVEFHFYKFIKYARNETLKTRKLEQRISDSEKYMELMDNFQQAFDELQTEDSNQKRLTD